MLAIRRLLCRAPESGNVGACKRLRDRETDELAARKDLGDDLAFERLAAVVHDGRKLLASSY